jgi:hypothetical protein
MSLISEVDSMGVQWPKIGEILEYRPDHGIGHSSG